MNTYTIVLERIGTGEHALSMVTRQENATAARAYAAAAIAQSPDLRVVEIHTRPSDAATGRLGVLTNFQVRLARMRASASEITRRPTVRSARTRCG